MRGLAVNVSSPPFIPRLITSTLGFPRLLEDGGYKYEATRMLSAENVKGMTLVNRASWKESLSQTQDKSKADAVAKVVVCGQVIWFIAQCISRFINRLPINLRG
ncbi:uncharacterized protein K441DRAFT_277803 [Cenococcum geophilum 1.58]|uniref:uncharacterized protein n=1 Tax=Cenococcum geophilum 1.58 TaxID=794803 RepID=UPI00358E341A|nr:hypothetical protein K441DRAFT_277803 [Cenococcum geophilum 1.58]